MFLPRGGAGLLWLLPRYAWGPCGGGQSGAGPAPARDPGPGTAEICRRRDAWGTFIGNFCCNYAYYFLLTWLPSYLVMERGLSMSVMAGLASLPFCASATRSLAGGWASDRWIARRGSPTPGRKHFVVPG